MFARARARVCVRVRVRGCVYARASELRCYIKLRHSRKVFSSKKVSIVKV